MPSKKPENWKDDLTVLVREGKTYEECVTELTAKYGSKDGDVGASTYGKIKKLAFPEDKTAEVLEDVGELRRKKEKKFKLPPWSSQKQSAADKSQLAGVLNQIIFLGMPCPSGKLELKHIEEINLGGGIVGTIQYVFPTIDLSNPILVLVLRVGLLFVKVRKICYEVRRKLSPINPLYRGEARPEDAPQEAKEELKNKSMHPTDVFMQNAGLFEVEDKK